MGVTKYATDEVKERIAKKKKKQGEAEAKITPKKGSIATKTTVSATDIKQAKTANQLDEMQRRIDDMPDGNIKTAYQKMLTAQRDRFEKMQSDEVDTTQRKALQGAHDARMKKKNANKPNPLMEDFERAMAEGKKNKKRKGGVMKKAMPFNKGGMSSRKGNFDMRKGGMFSK